MLGAAEAHQLEVLRRAIEDGVELDRRIARQVQMPEGLLVDAVGQVLIEAGVLLVGDLILRFDPDRPLVIELLAVELDRVRDECRILADDVLQPERLGEFVQPLLEVQAHDRSALQTVGRFDCEAARAIGFPSPAAVFAVTAAEHFHAVGQHESGIEPDAELADQGQVGFGVAREAVEKLQRSAVGDRAEVLDQLFAGHADPAVDDVEPSLFFVRLQADLQRAVAAMRFICQLDMAHLVERVRRVRNQLADRDLAVLVERVREEMQELLDLGLERVFLFLGRGGHRSGGLRCFLSTTVISCRYSDSIIQRNAEHGSGVTLKASHEAHQTRQCQFPDRSAIFGSVTTCARSGGSPE